MSRLIAPEQTDEPRERSIEAFANYFIGFIHAQTEDSSKYVLPKCETPRKTYTGSAVEGAPIDILGKSSIIDGSGYSTSGIPDTSTPLAECRSMREPDTTGSPGGYMIARKLFDHGDPPIEVGAHSIADEQQTAAAAAVGTTPKRYSNQAALPNGFSTPGTNHNQSLSRVCRSTGGTVSSTSPLPSNGAEAGNLMMSISSTPIRRTSGREKPRSSRNASLEVSHPSPSVASGSQRSESFRSADCSGPASDGGGATRRSKTASPCLGDFVVTHKTKSQKSLRRSPFTSSNQCSEQSGPNPKHAKDSSIFLEHDFPHLGVAPTTSTPEKNTTDGEVGQGQKKRAAISTRPLVEQLEPLAGGASVKKVTGRRRIAPTTVSRTVSGQHDFTSSSLKSENNLVAIESVEETANDPRGMLRRLKDEIRNDFEAQQAQMDQAVRAKQSLEASFGQLELIGVPGELSAPDAQPICSSEDAVIPGRVLVIEFARVTQKAIIDRLVAIYALLMDLNLVPNVLNELAYLINLISTERLVPLDTTSGGVIESTEENSFSVLQCPHNCVYFATEVLYRQRLLLGLLDATSLRVVVENEQLSALQPTLNGFLREMLAQKVKLENVSGLHASNSSDLLANSSISNVFYQQENDTKDHFPSMKEFASFNKQRDCFYIILRNWESEHLNPAWEFDAKLGPKVRAMLDILSHPINMTHLAKLFCAQLIISFNFDNSATELQMALPSIDLTKLSKLRQRLEAPSIFSTQYLFPGSQTFFRDFIVASEKHPTFIEQLKAVLIHELLQMNGSSYDIFSISDPENKSRTEYLVRSETIATMRVLAKFIGFIIARPFQYEGCRSTLVENRQIELRNTLLPLFDVKPVLLQSVVDRKLVITVPWLVQYLSMLDVVTLRLRYYVELFRVLRDIYQATAMCGVPAVNHNLFVVPTSKFIVRSCLDWLFDQSNVPEEYFNSSQLDGNGGGSVITEKLRVDRFGVETVSNRPSVTDEKKIYEIPIVFNPLLESVVSAACPFLADFRVSVMPSKMEKTVSRTGRYRHITTCYTGAKTPANEGSTTMDTTASNSSKSIAHTGNNHSKSGHANVQARLVEAFLQSQSLSLRRTVEFIMERTTSAVIKDFQIMFLLPEKKMVTDRIAAVSGNTVKTVKQQIFSICDTALTRINGTWESHVPKMLNKRITESFDALLPAETIDEVRTTCKKITLEKCLQKTNEWRQSNMLDIELFCKSVPSEAEIIFSKQQRQSNKGSMAETGLSIPLNVIIIPSSLYGKLQMFVHLAASCPEELAVSELLQFLAQTNDFLDEPELILPAAMHRTLAYMLLQLFLLLIKSRCDLIVPEIIEPAIRVWKHSKLAKHCLPPLVETDESRSFSATPSHERSFGYPSQIEQFCRKQKQQDANYVFAHLISNRVIRMLEENSTPSANYDSYELFITALLDAELITINLLNEQFVRVFNEEWPKPTLDRISVIINRVLHKNGHSQQYGHNIDDSHSEMFLQLLSDLARDITDF